MSALPAPQHRLTVLPGGSALSGFRAAALLCRLQAVAPQVTTRPPTRTARIDAASTSPPTWSSTTSTPRLPVRVFTAAAKSVATIASMFASPSDLIAADDAPAVAAYAAQSHVGRAAER